MTLLWIPVLAPILVAAVGYYLPRRVLRYVQLAFQLIQVSLVTRLVIAVRTSGPLRTVLGLWPDGIGVSLEADIVAAVLVALVGWLYLFLLLFNHRKLYMNRLFQFLLGALQGLLIAIFVSGDLFNIYVLLELSTLVISILIMYKRDKQAIYNGMVYVMINLASMSFMLLGVGMVYRVFGTLDLSLIADGVRRAGDLRALIIPYTLVMTAVGVKSALFLLFAWLPPAHGAPSAPSIVSAILSGLQVKAGVYLFIRLQAMFAPAFSNETYFLIIGVLTSVTGFLFAIAQKDIKLILAYHTVSQVGLIIVGLSAGTSEAWWGGVYHIVNHALFKGLLFLTAGLITHVYKTRNVAEIRGVFRRMPLVTSAAIAGVLGITGAPYFNGSVSKYLIQSGWRMSAGEIAIHVINLGTAISFTKFSTIFFGKPPEAVRARRRQPDPFTTTVALIMGGACLAGGVAAAPILRALFGTNMSVDGAYYAEKTLFFAATVAIAVATYVLVVKRTTLFDSIRRMHFAFNDIVAGVLVFFVATAAYLYFTV